MREGLARVLADTPVRSGYLELQAGASSLSGLYARGELGYRPWEDVAGFLFGQWTPQESTAGVGVKLTFGGP